MLRCLRLIQIQTGRQLSGFTSSTRSDLSSLREILRLASSDLDAAKQQYAQFNETNDIPDWGAVKMSSFLVAKGAELQEAERLLKEHYEETGGTRRLARKATVEDDQISAALRRVTSSEVGGVERGRRLYELMLKMKYCANKDQFIVLFVGKALEKSGVDGALKCLEELLSLGRVNSLTRTLLLLSRFVHSNGTDEERDRVHSLLCSRLPAATVTWMEGFILLESGRGVDWAEQLHSSKTSLTIDGVRYLRQLAVTAKTPLPLRNLLDLHVLFRLNSQRKSLIYEELIRMYGKRGNIEDLDRMAEMVVAEGRESGEFQTNRQMLLHFYKCVNRSPPHSLLEAVREV